MSYVAYTTPLPRRLGPLPLPRRLFAHFYWQDDSGAANFLGRFGGQFAEYRRGAQWFALVAPWRTTAAALIIGTGGPTTNCRARLGAVLAILLAHAALLVARRPLRDPPVTALRTAIVALLACCTLAGIALELDPYVAGFVTAAGALLLVDIAWALVRIAVHLHRLSRSSALGGLPSAAVVMVVD